MMGVAMYSTDPNARGVYDVPRTMVGLEANGEPDAHLLHLMRQVHPFINEALDLLKQNADAFKGRMEASTVNTLRHMDYLRMVLLQVGKGRECASEGIDERTEWRGVCELNYHKTLTAYPPSFPSPLPFPLLSQDAPFWKKSHPDLPFWRLPDTVFVTAEFAAWEKRVLRETAAGEREKATASEDIAAVPGSIASLKAEVGQLRELLQNLLVSQEDRGREGRREGGREGAERVVCVLLCALVIRSNNNKDPRR
jgi:hypothetical protein